MPDIFFFLEDKDGFKTDSALKEFSVVKSHGLIPSLLLGLAG